MGRDLSEDQKRAGRDWFDSFVSQAPAHCHLGTGSPTEFLGGGLSGATVVVVNAADDVIVIKRAELPKILAEAEARRKRAESAYASARERERFQTLRRRGASHISVHARSPQFDSADSPPDALFGVIAYEYVGRDSQSNQGVRNLEDYIRSYTISEVVGLESLQNILESVLGTLFKPNHHYDDGAQRPDDDLTPDGKPARLIRTTALIASIGLEKKWCAVTNHPWGDQVSPQDLVVLKNLDTLWSRIAVRHRKPSFPDSRLVHGDPRLANILVNPLTLGEPDLIDYGDGGPGRHVFHDLARIEADILFRATKVENRTADPHVDAARPVNEVEARASLLFAPLQGSPPDDRRLRIAHTWRDARDRMFAELPRARDTYWLFVLTELLRRLTWHIRDDAGSAGNAGDTGNTTLDDRVGATVPEIMSAIRVLVADGNLPT